MACGSVRKNIRNKQRRTTTKARSSKTVARHMADKANYCMYCGERKRLIYIGCTYIYIV